MRHRIVELHFSEARRGSIEILLGVVVLEELCREFHNGQLVAAFLTDVFAGFFNSILIAAGHSVRERFRRGLNSQLVDAQKHDEELTARVHADLVHLVAKMGRKTGLTAIRSHADVRQNQVTASST